jgi:predicted membrane GTPase involved in stress response
VGLETQQMEILNDIFDFLEKVEMSAEEMLLNCIYSDGFRGNSNCVEIDKEDMLNEIKNFLYNYC